MFARTDFRKLVEPRFCDTFACFRSAPKSWENPSNSGVRAFWPAPEMRKLVEPVRVCTKLADKNVGGNFSREGEPKMAFRHQRGRRGRDGGREGEGEGQAALAAVAGPSQNGQARAKMEQVLSPNGFGREPKWTSRARMDTD